MGKGRMVLRATVGAVVLTGAVLGADSGIEFEALNAPWQFGSVKPWDQKNVQGKLHNKTSMPQKIEGLRFTIPDKPDQLVRYNDPKLEFSGLTDGNTNPRYEMRIMGENSMTNQKYNRLEPKTSLALNLEATGIVANADFTPQNPQFLVKTGSFASDKFYKNAPPITLVHLKWLVDNWAPFYDEDLYLLDTLGANGGPVSAGFIDTWYDQVGDSSLFQVQVCIPDKPIKQNGIWARLNLGIMGEESGEAGPMYAMSLAGEQEIMNVDMQLLIASGTNEKQAGLQKYEYDNITGQPTVLGGSAFIDDQDDQQLGPFNFINTSFNGYIFDCNRKFFPYDTSRPSPYFYTATPGMEKKIGGNSPQLVNAALLSSLYYWFLFDGMFNFKNVWVEDIYRKAKDRRIGGKLALNAWRFGFDDDAGFGADILYKQPEVYNNPDVTDMIAKKEYLHLMDNAMLPLLDANIRSVNNGAGGTCEIYDDSISLDHLEQFFFGLDDAGYDADGATGSLGKGGLLWHYSVSEEQRIKMWNDVEAAFNYLKGKAPSTKNLTGDYISFRYDFLGVLRVARQYFDIERPMPNGIEFERFVLKHAVPDVVSGKSGKKIEGIYPYLVKDDRFFDADDAFILKIKATDETYLNIDSAAVVEWTLNPELLGWVSATHLTGDTLSSEYEVKISAKVLEDTFGEKGGIGWVRVTDRNFNSTVDTFNIEGVKFPRIQHASAQDSDGDGLADSIVVVMRKGQADGAFALDSWTKCRYAWPEITPVVEKNKDEIDDYDAGKSMIMLIDPDLTGGAGIGLVEFDYPEDNVVTANVDDSVGPAISSAITPIEDPRDRDTVHLNVSEPLTKIDKENFLYCLFKKGSTVNEIKAEKFIHVKDLEYKAIFAKGSIIDQDSVRFAFDVDPLEDAVGNKPASYNQWVPLTKDGGKVPEIAAASMLDTDGDGDGDSIAVNFNLGEHSDKYTTADISGGKYSWTGNSLSEVLSSGDMIAVGEDKFSLMYDSPEAKGEGKISLNFPEDIVLEAIINDKVGPALQSASLSIQDDGRLFDTLIVTLNEELTGFDKKDHDYIIFDSESGLTNAKEILKVTEKSYKILFDKGSILAKKKVKLAFDSDPVLDTYGNKPMDINQWIPLEIIGGKEAMVSSAAVYDIDGDGRGDSVFVELTLGSAVDKYTTADITGGKYSWPGTTLTEVLETGDMLSVSDNKFSFYYDTDATSGLGEIELSFPDNVDLTGELRDKVGPVIDKATCLQQDGGRDKDTLLLETSEIIADNFNNDTKYIIIFENESDSDGDTLNVETITEESGTYRVVVAKNAITYGDWIQFNFDSGIEDKSGNRPLTINQKVLITVKGGVLPTISEAAIYDVKGNLNRIDGNGDSIFVELSLADDPRALTVDSLKSVDYEWGGISGSKNPDQLVRISDSRFAIIDESLKGGSGTGSVTLNFKNDFDPITADLDDRIAPVISSATYYNWSSVKDTLVVTFSEAVKDGGSDKALLASGGKKLTLKEQSVDGAKVIYSIEGGDDLAYGDSLWVKANEEIIDLVKNEQATDDNIRVRINYFRVAQVKEMVYAESDERPDGYIDEVILTFDSELDESVKDALLGAISLADERKFTKGEVIIDDERAILTVSQDQNQVSANTATEDYDVVTLPYAEGSDTLACVAGGEISVVDELAPVILSARFTPAEKENSDGKLMDELIVTYSEAVRTISRDEPFTLSDASDGDSEYTLTLKGDKSGRENVLYFAEYRKGMKLPGARDSIWIADDGEVEDENGNVQQKNTAPVELVVGTYARGFIVAVTPTPFDLAEAEDSSVAVIRVLPDSRALPDNIRAQCVIYDKVGNVIRKVSAEQFGEIEDGTLSYEFIPKNENGRRLGEGAYAIQFLIETEGSKPATPMTHLFIKGIQPGQSEKKDDDSEE